MGRGDWKFCGCEGGWRGAQAKRKLGKLKGPDTSLSVSFLNHVQLSAIATCTELIERAEDAKLEYWAGTASEKLEVEEEHNGIKAEEKEQTVQ